MATNTKQLLSLKELYKKLGGGSSSSNEVKDAGAISSTWGSNVYIVGGLSGTVVPNNGEIRPVFNLKYGNTAAAAYNNNSLTSINVKDDSWDSSSQFSINDSTCYFYSGSSAVGAGYYMQSTPISGTTDRYNYYKTTSAGKVNETGIYIAEYFHWTNSAVTVNRDGDYAYAEYSTNDSDITITSKYRARLDGTVTSTTDSYLNVDIQSAYPRLRLYRDQISSSYPITVVTARGTHFNTYYYHELLVVPPWDIYGSNITGVSSSGSTVTPTVNTNMGGYTLSSDKLWATVSGNNVIIDASTDPSTRTATITATGRVSGTWSTIAYDSGDVSGTFTITQNAYVPPTTRLYVVVRMADTTTAYLSTSPSHITSGYLVAAPANILIKSISVSNALGYTRAMRPAGTTLQSGNSTVTLRYEPDIPDPISGGTYTDPATTINNSGTAEWSSGSAPTGYVIDGTVRWLTN